MPISPEKIAEIRDRVDIERVVGRSVRLSRKGARAVGLCPFHPEKTPSFGVDVSKKLYHCFGCQAGGDVFDFVMRIEGISFREAALILGKEVGVEVEDREEDPREREARQRRERLFTVNSSAAAFFERALENDPHAWDYVTKERGLSKQTIEAFRIGWAPDNWSALTEHLDKKRVDLRLPIALGLLGTRQSDGKPYDRLRGRVIFPIGLPGGDIAGFGARRTDWVDKEGPKYLNSPESPIYDKSSILYGLDKAKDEIRKSKRAVLVEGYVDVIGLHQVGVRQAIAACGTALSSRHAGMLKRLATEVFTMYDGDAAGQDATRKAAAILLAEGLSVRVATLPEGEDPDTFAHKAGADGVRRLLEEAPSAIDFFVSRAENAVKGGGIAGIAKAVESVKPLLLALKDPLERDVSIDAAAKKLDIQPQVLRKHLTAHAPSDVRPTEPPRDTLPARATRGPTSPEKPAPATELALLKMFIESPDDVLRALEDHEAIRAFSDAAIQAAIDAGIEALRSGRPFDAPRALETAAAAGASDAKIATFRRTLMESLPQRDDLTACVKQLLRSRKLIRVQQLTQLIAREKDPAVLAELAAESARLNRELDSLK